MTPLDPVLIRELILRLGAATLAGGVLGLNRELHGKAAGLRTHALVALGSAVVTTIALHPETIGNTVDPNALSRIIQGTLTGIGFIGAGVILRDTAGHVSGLTTAATVWVCAGLGIVCGLGYWHVLSIAFVLVLLVLLTGKPIERLAEKLFRHRPSEHVNHHDA
ncbi:MAG TPA: MgtC/SapB family protein [Blastocatellia bacterium]|nr:MgtC/SapB family protein [Blastocatellia bacterium]